MGFGERIQRNRIINHKGELKHVEHIAKLRALGHSYWKIAEILNSMGVPTKSRRAKWQAATVMKILKRTSELAVLI